MSFIKGYPQTNKPNLISILTDDQGYNNLGCFGSRLSNTVNYFTSSQ